MKRLKNKVAIVTGAANGIGLGTVKAFVEEGASVVMADINEEKCQNEANLLLEKGAKVLAVCCNVGNSKSVKSMINTCLKTYGKIDILVNNAAVGISGNIVDMPEEDWDLLMNVNLKSVFLCTQACMPYMLSAKRGSIINMASTQAHRSWDDFTAYASAKGAILSMTKQLAGQFASSNIRFNSISPGTINTPMLTERLEEEGEEMMKPFSQMHAMQRIGEAGEVASAVVFLASDESSFITGIDIKIDGGLSTLPRYIVEPKNTV